MEQSSTMAQLMAVESKNVRELLERFGKASGSTNAGEMNQQELEETLQVVPRSDDEQFREIDSNISQNHVNGLSRLFLQKDGFPTVVFAPDGLAQ